MSWQLSFYHVPLVLGAVVSFSMASVSFSNRSKRTATQLTGMLVGAGIWAAADALQLASTAAAPKVFWYSVRFVGSTLLVLATLLFALEYTNREQWLTRGVVACLAAPLVLTVVLVWTNAYHELVWTDVAVVRVNGLYLAEFEFAVWALVNAVYSYLLLFITFTLYVAHYVSATADTYRNQTLALSIALLVPWTLNGIYIADRTLVDLTSFGLVITGVALFASVFWFKQFDQVPIARSTVVDHVEHGVLVVDTDDRVVDANAAAAGILGRPQSRLVGSTIGRLSVDAPAFAERFGDVRNARDTISMDLDGERRHFDVEISPLYSRTHRILGRLILVRDVTDRRHRQQQLEERTEQLEEQNERLDQFASIVSHDLRNPINVAEGHVDLARQTGEEEHFEEIAHSLDRMQEITDDVLTLARESDDVTELERVSLSEVAEEAWDTVDVQHGSLVVETEATIEADPRRLQRLFENLVRNAYEHGPADATVTVGELGNGFYLEDDGPDIPEADRDRVLEEGFTTREEGTGLGLSIVTAIVEAHGWSVTVTEGTDGGARFEITGVSPVTAEARSEPDADD